LSAPRSERLDAELPDPERHLDFVARQSSDPVVVPWHWPEREDGSGGPRTRAQALELLERHRRQLEERGFTWWPWRERASGELVALVGLNAAKVEGEPVVEVGWSVAPARWGEGIATEAARASLTWGFEVCELDEIVSFTQPRNLRSRRVMEKLGMEYARDFDRDGLPHVLYTARR
jgi:RimJ/RimL family protein N-acetyltransferase